MGQAPTLADLNAAIAGTEPRVRDLDLAAWLGFERLRDIRKLIERNLEELGTHGGIVVTPSRGAGAPVEVGGGKLRHDGANTPPTRGPVALEYWLNEQQALLICMFSRTDRAAEVRKQVIDVYVAWRRGTLPAAAAATRLPEVDDLPYLTPAERGLMRSWEGKRDAAIRRLNDIVELARRREAWEREIQEEEDAARRRQEEARRQREQRLLTGGDGT